MTSASRGNELETYAASRLGTTLRGKYRLDAVIGLGGMAVVYKATHRNQAEFAVKMLHPELSMREDVRTRFVREGYAANSVKHPGVVLVVDDDVADDGAAFIVMELIDGAGCETLWDNCGGRMPIAAVCSVGQQLLDVLASAHAKGIVHRDLKPANLFVTRDGRLKVLDFGIARVRDVAATSATATGMLLGTPAFMGPEQALAKTSEIDAQTDLWAVGATLFTMLSGSLVHEGDNAQQILIKAATQPARSLVTVAPGVPELVVAVIDRALAFDKVERWSTAAAMRDALAAACERTTGVPPSTSALALLVTGGAPKSTEDHRSTAAVAETVAVRAARTATQALHPSGPVGPVAAHTIAAAPLLASPSLSAKQLMGVSTATPVASERRTASLGSRHRSGLWALGALVLLGVLVASFAPVRRRPDRIAQANEPVAVPSSDSSTLPPSGSASRGSGPSPAGAALPEPAADTAISASAASLTQLDAGTNRPPVSRPTLPRALGGAAPEAALRGPPSPPAPRVSPDAPLAPLAPPAPPASSCRRVSIVGADGETHFKKVCE